MLFIALKMIPFGPMAQGSTNYHEKWISIFTFQFSCHECNDMFDIMMGQAFFSRNNQLIHVSPLGHGQFDKKGGIDPIHGDANEFNPNLLLWKHKYNINVMTIAM